MAESWVGREGGGGGLCTLCNMVVYRSSDERITSSLSHIVSLSALKKELEAQRSETYSEDCAEHRGVLLEVR